MKRDEPRLSRWQAFLVRRFCPDRVARRVTDIDPDELWHDGVRGVAFDFDNTIVAWKGGLQPPEREWLLQMKARGLKLTILSNASFPRRVQQVADELGLLYLARAGKPFATAFRKALAQLDLPAQEVVMIGDQLMTDILGARAAGMRTILVTPLVDHDFIGTRVHRMIERPVLSWLRKRGFLVER